MTRSGTYSSTISQITLELQNTQSGLTFHSAYSSNSNVSQIYISS